MRLLHIQTVCTVTHKTIHVGTILDLYNESWVSDKPVVDIDARINLNTVLKLLSDTVESGFLL